MNVKIKFLHKNAEVPFKTHKLDFCYDLVATSEEQIAPNVWRYGFGIALEAERSAGGYGSTDEKHTCECKCSCKDKEPQPQEKDATDPSYYKANFPPQKLSDKTGALFSVGCIIKYIYRYKNKDGVKDLHKALKYLSFISDEPVWFLEPFSKVAQLFGKFLTDNEKFTSPAQDRAYHCLVDRDVEGLHNELISMITIEERKTDPDYICASKR